MGSLLDDLRGGLILPPRDSGAADPSRSLSFGRRPSVKPSGYGPADIIGGDDRTLIGAENRRLAPWRHICALVALNPEGEPAICGTAFLIGPRLALTAAHCIPRDLEWVEIIPGYAPGAKPFGSQRLPQERLRHHPSYWSYADNDSDEPSSESRDAGALLLERPFEGIDDWLAISSPAPEKLIGARADLSGYPLKPPRERPEPCGLWTARNVISAAPDRKLAYAIDATPGQSGSPVWTCPEEGAPPFVVGIHAYGPWGDDDAPPGELNSATRIDADLAEIIQTWSEESLA